MKVKSEREVAQSCLTLSDPVDCSLPGSSVDGIFQARVLEWVAIAFSDTHTSLLYYLLLQYLHSFGRELKSLPFQQNGTLFWNVLSNALGSDIPFEPRLEVPNINLPMKLFKNMDTWPPETLF